MTLAIIGADVAWGAIALVGSLGSIGALAWFAARGHVDRDEEDAAREYYERHGRWPDEA